jgi:hypothetical protein
LSATGNQFQDWTAAYRLFAKNRFSLQKLFAPAITSVLDMQENDSPLFTMMDDTIVRKCGRKVDGAGWKRDPLGPKFHTNFVWGQRYLQISAVLPDFEVSGLARGIPVDFCHAPSPIKPRKGSPPEDWDEYKEQQKLCKISTVGAERLAELRKQVPDRKIVCAVDGGFTNKEVFQSVPENTVLIGRIRKDAHLYKVPETQSDISVGRKKYYGDSLPTPEQVLRDDSIPWEKVTAFAAGKHHVFEVKSVNPVRWKSTKDKNVLLVVVRPLAYRPRKGAKLMYRNPAYLICSDPQLPLQQLLQAYVWRWEIELNFRDEKSILGVGEAQVRTPAAVENAPAFIVAVYAYLLLAAHSIKADSSCLPLPKWRERRPAIRYTTQSAIALFRSQFWGSDFELEPKKSGFASTSPDPRTHFFSSSSINSAVCYAYK